MEKLKELPIRVELELLEEELQNLLTRDNYQISAPRQDTNGDYVVIEISKKKTK